MFDSWGRVLLRVVTRTPWRVIFANSRASASSIPSQPSSLRGCSAGLVGLSGSADGSECAPADLAVRSHAHNDCLTRHVMADHGAFAFGRVNRLAQGGRSSCELLIKRVLVLQTAHQLAAGAGDAQR